MSASCIWFWNCQQERPEHAGFTHPIPVFYEYVVVAADGDKEEHDLHVVEDMYPLLPFRSLTTNVEHAVCEVAELEDGLGDTSRPQSRS
jgi:hypothetical protein